MAELTAKTPCAGLLPFEAATVILSEEDLGCLTALAPYRGRGAALAAALEAAHGLAMPGPNRSTGKAGSRAIWFGRDTVLLAGPEPDARLAAEAALTDQSDGWAAVRLEGAQAAEVLARLTPLDLRRQMFKRGHTARTELRHMMVSITRVGETAFVILAFRSMAASLVADLKTAMEAIAARG